MPASLSGQLLRCGRCLGPSRQRASTAKDKVRGQDPVAWASGAPRSHTSTGKNAGDGRSGHVLLGNKQPFTQHFHSTASVVSVSGRGSARSSDPGAAGLSEASPQAAWRALGDLILEMISPLSAASISYSGRRAARSSPHQVGGHRAPPGAASHSLTYTDRPALRLWPRARLSGRPGASLPHSGEEGGGPVSRRGCSGACQNLLLQTGVQSLDRRMG